MSRRCYSPPKAPFLVRRRHRQTLTVRTTRHHWTRIAVWPTGSSAKTGQRSFVCPDCASKNKTRRQRHQDTEKAALKSRLDELGAEPLAAAAACVRSKHTGEAANAGGVPAAAASTPAQYTNTRAAARPPTTASTRARRRADNPEREAARVALTAGRQ